VPLAGIPLVGRILRGLAAAGLRRVVLNLHHRPESIARVVGDGSDLGLTLRYSWEQAAVTAGGRPTRRFSGVVSLASDPSRRWHASRP